MAIPKASKPVAVDKNASDNVPDGLKNKHTVYVNNLDERTRIPLLKDTLHDIFSQHGEIVDIRAKGNTRMHGQAWITFKDPKAAAKAISACDGFTVFKKPMKCQWARTASDVTALAGKTDAQAERHKAARGADRDRRIAVQAGTKRKAADDGGRSRKMTRGGKAATVPDEYLLPNRTLLINQVPADFTKDQLIELFSQYDHFKEVRTTSFRPDVAFAEYNDVEGAISAKQATNNLPVGATQQELRVTYQRPQQEPAEPVQNQPVES